MSWKFIKKANLIIFILLASQIISGQVNINNEWYTPVRNKFLKIIIKNDSIILTKQSFNLKEDSEYSHEGLFKIESKLFKDNQFSFIVSENVIVDKNLNTETTENKTQYKILAFNLDNLTNRLFISINSLDSTFVDKESAQSFLNTESTNQFRIKLYDKIAIEKERVKKDVSEITLNDLKKYLQDMIAFDKQNKLSRKYKLNYVFNESIYREILSKSGYNSLVNGRTFQKIIEKYSNDVEIKKLIEEIKTSNME